MSMTADEAFAALTAFGRVRRPCFFAFDFELRHPVVQALDQIDSSKILYDLRGVGNAGARGGLPGAGSAAFSREPIFFDLEPPEESRYRAAFDIVRQAFIKGDSYLLNLTGSTRLHFSGSLKDLFHLAKAPYRLCMAGFLVFSPETFVRIEHERISTFPMKGSLRCTRASLAAGRHALLDNPKEQAEHVTVVDLLRNDLGRVAREVTVPRFRYLDEIPFGDSVLLQTSSEIHGILESGWQDNLGEILSELLPAGSITGAPKRRTSEYIREAESLLDHSRDWYSGVFGVFDGDKLDSAVMIRYLEDLGPEPVGEGHRGIFKSGGGITFDSSPADEYREMVDKVAFPMVPALMETVRVQDGCMVRPEAHGQRMIASALRAWGRPLLFDPVQALAQSLESARVGLAGLAEGRWRFRIDYDPLGIRRVELVPYHIRRPRILFLVEAGDLDYGCKYADRSGLDALRRQVPAEGDDWDVILCRGDGVLETSYTALVCRLGGCLVTPQQPLLPSTAIAGLVAGGRVEKTAVSVPMLMAAGRAFLVNAMIDLEDAVEVTDIRDARHLLSEQQDKKS